MSTSIGYLVNSVTGESVPLERCLVVVGSGVGTPTVMDKTSGFFYDRDSSWVWLGGSDDSPPEVMNHPTFRLRMLGEANRNGTDLSAIKNFLGFGATLPPKRWS